MKLDDICEVKEEIIDRLDDWKPDTEPDIFSSVWPDLCHILQVGAGDLYLS